MSAMPTQWTIDHARQLVVTIVDGVTTPEEAKGFFDDVETLGAIPYKKLFDCTRASAKVDERLVASVRARIAGYTNQGPLAVVVDSSYFDGLARLVLLALGADGRARVFKTIEEAQAWLDSIELKGEAA
jgi:hypothetical protein